ncbi:hypothetical protein Bdt_3422 [Bdellovibrio bacteriovorus str. Tiberius]|uniref:Uncharacterized protein n=2 Tax=Bdellovibrio bacteriovorus TaxID=959 RepID=K7ZH42_BDEBC|nr:hypothetical protein Bdt_3422 [Bdellovibrio bacteriovorus str. Tiberius]
MLTACAGGGGSDSKADAKAQAVDADGNCTQEFVSKYNTVVLEFSHLQMLLGGYPNEQRILEQMKATNAACKKVFPAYAGVTCKAEVQNEIQQISSDTYKEGCQMLKEGMAKHGL